MTADSEPAGLAMSANDRPETTLKANPQRPSLLRPTWPFTVLVLGFPVLWALGLSAFATQVLAVPMAVQLFRRGSVRMPRGFGLWILFLLCSAIGLLVLGVNPQGTVPGSFSGRLIGFGVRESGYVAITVIMLYVGNLSEQELPERKVIRQLGIFFLAVTAGGVLGLVFPNVSFTSPLELVLPHSISSVPYVTHLIHPAFAQVQEFGGSSLPRPSAPFPYTNTWGSQISLLAIWFFVGTVAAGTRRTRILAVAALAVALVTVFYSLNRGVWLGVLLSVAFLIAVLARRGRLVLLASLLLAVIAAAVLFVQSPLKQVYDQRIENGNSDQVRTFTSRRAFDLSLESPVIGLGTTRSAIGSASSISIGKSAKCPSCGNVPIGINGYVYTLLVTTGFIGTGLFFAFWASQLWWTRRDRSVVASACRLTLLLSTFYGFFYDAELLVPFVAIALLWRRQETATSEEDRNFS